MTTKDFAAWIIRVVCGIKLLPTEAFPTGPAIYFANHSSHLDFTTIWAAMPHGIRTRVRPVAGRDYWEKTPRRLRIAKGFFNAVLIERHRVTVASNPLEPMLAALDAGDSLIVFPEGTRSLDGRILPFKSGLHHLAKARPSVVLVPIYLQDLNRILPKGDFLPVPLLGSMSLGASLRFETDENKTAFLERARQAVQKLAPSPL